MDNNTLCQNCPYYFTKFPRFGNHQSPKTPSPINNLMKKLDTTSSSKMSESEYSGSESQENDSPDEESEYETPWKEEKASEYELKRLKRIEENKKRMEALGLRKMASSLMGSVQKSQIKKIERKGKRKMVDEDEEYKPCEIEENSSSSEEDASDDEKFSGSRSGKAKKKTLTPKKKVSIQELLSNSEFVDDDAALMQAISLSLQETAEFSNTSTSTPSRSPGDALVNDIGNEREGNHSIQEDTGKRKRKKLAKQNNSPVQMTEDEMVIHFFQFDETGKGNVSLRDIQRAAEAHDFTWSEKEISDMIYFFDGDGDGKLNLDDFHKIVGRCNMIKDSSNGAR